MTCGKNFELQQKQSRDGDLRERLPSNGRLKRIGIYDY